MDQEPLTQGQVEAVSALLRGLNGVAFRNLLRPSSPLELQGLVGRHAPGRLVLDEDSGLWCWDPDEDLG